MRRWLPVAVILAVCFFLAAAAWAATFRAVAVGNLRATARDGVITLTWTAEIVRSDVANFGPTEVTVLRDGQIIRYVPLPEKTGRVTMTCTDRVAPGTYRYTVECGSGPGRSDSVQVTVDERGNSGSAGEGGKCYIDERRRQYEESADWPERLAGSVVMAIPNWLMQVLGLYDPVELVFQVRLEEPLPGSENLDDPANAKWLHTFTDAEVAALDKFYARISEFVPLHLVVALVILALGVWWSQAW